MWRAAGFPYVGLAGADGGAGKGAADVKETPTTVAPVGPFDFVTGCCNSNMVEETTYHYEVGGPYKTYKCPTCKLPTAWAIDFPAHTSSGGKWSRESYGVFQDHQGKKYFAWCQGSDPFYIKESIEHGGVVICAVKGVVDTIGLRHNTQDIDMLPNGAHERFMREYVSQVENPELYDLRRA